MTTKHFNISDATPVIVDAGQQHHTTWGAFLDDNKHAIEAGEIVPESILAVWAKVSTATYHGGGGAMADWTIRIANYAKAEVTR